MGLGPGPGATGINFRLSATGSGAQPSSSMPFCPGRRAATDTGSLGLFTTEAGP